MERYESKVQWNRNDFELLNQNLLHVKEVWSLRLLQPKEVAMKLTTITKKSK